ncbi:MAG: hypothetical protein DRP95_07185 [Candidatus Latescibacterota bacterium]|nr:MAG: hypothetical protein DRP95_07185 [Candidatus Latescibacterota bacterium]
MTIEPGTEMVFKANWDDQHGGYDPEKCELIVEGTLEANGVTFKSGSGSPSNSDWQGIRVLSRGSANLTNCTIEHAVVGVSSESSSSVTSQEGFPVFGQVVVSGKMEADKRRRRSALRRLFSVKVRKP